MYEDLDGLTLKVSGPSGADVIPSEQAALPAPAQPAQAAGLALDLTGEAYGVDVMSGQMWQVCTLV